ncbi:TPA: glutamate--tRNA ligase, partial [Candidatus Bathyarchaeota archaeon]|nr:glutamate--tRNA ligase [Candidatus Bathyarchaeota archaeon]
LKRGSVVRLMELFNVRVESVSERAVTSRFYSEAYTDARRLRAPLIHWLPYGVGVKASVVMPDGSVMRGVAEPGCRDLRPGAMIQFERFGFVRVDGVNERLLAFFANK